MKLRQMCFNFYSCLLFLLSFTETTTTVNKNKKHTDVAFKETKERKLRGDIVSGLVELRVCWLRVP